MTRHLLLAMTLAVHAPLVAQAPTGVVRLQVTAGGAAGAGAEVRADNRIVRTDAAGHARLELPLGLRIIRVVLLGYEPSVTHLLVTAGMDTTLVVALAAAAVEIEAIVVQSTRSDRRIEDEPVRVEVLGREEIEEKMLMTPGDIAMMLNETSGLRVQTTSPSLGGAGVRIQGLRGRYTQLLTDGLPLYGGQSGALGLLQVPPMDLAQVEVIKGVASALYGSSALGGVVNLISRRPDGARRVLLNQTTRGGTDGVLWSSGSLSDALGYTLIAGGHRQTMHDVNADGWADLAGYRRVVARPRVFWDDGLGRSVLVTVGGTVERREGGTLRGAVTPDGTPYTEALETRRGDIGLLGRFLLGEARTLTVRGSVMGQQHEHTFGPVQETDRHATGFGEVALAGQDGAHFWVVGLSVQRELYRSTDVPRFDYTHTVPSVFVQDEVIIAPWATVAVSGRVDAHSAYGTQLSPRLSLLLRPGSAWTFRASGGAGYFAPTPFTEETEVVGLTQLAALGTLVVERARSMSLDAGRALGALEMHVTLFASEVTDPVQLREPVPGTAELVNASDPTRTWGTDVLLRYHRDALHVTATYTLTHSTEFDPPDGRRDVPRTPRHAAGLVAMWEAEHWGRVGAELYLTGTQPLADDPYGSAGRAHVITGLLVERRFGGIRVFLNAENLLDARQTRYAPLLLPGRSSLGRWTTDVWAPLEGRTFNAGVRLPW